MAGVVSGTLAWYQYSTRVNASYTGVAVNSVSSLQVGIKTDVDLSGYDLRQTMMEGASYWFANDGQGLRSDQILAYLEKTHFANNALFPVTTSTYSYDSNNEGPELSLYRTLLYTEATENTTCVAEHKAYVQIPLAFRISLYDDNELSTGTYSPWRNVWITEGAVALEGIEKKSSVENGLRVFVHGDLFTKNGDSHNLSETNYIYNPSSTGNGGTDVGGLLDLNSDGFYDYNGVKDAEGTQEIIYGKYTGAPTPVYDTNDYPYRKPNPDDLTDIGENYANPEVPDTFQDINQTGSTGHSTFTAAHRHHVYSYQSYDGIVFDQAKYLSLSTIQGNVNGAGVREGGKPVCTTDEAGVGNVLLTVYLEGWDHSVIDSGIDRSFSLNLNFEISNAGN